VINIVISRKDIDVIELPPNFWPKATLKLMEYIRAGKFPMIEQVTRNDKMTDAEKIAALHDLLGEEFKEVVEENS
jgi:hypothetical protein